MKPNKFFEDILQSDDELPTDYEDIPITPAYKMDNRFEPIKFRWIDSNFSKYYQKKLSQNNVQLPVLYSSLNEDVLFKRTEYLKPEEKPIILNRVLALHDIFCLKSIESSTSDTIFLCRLRPVNATSGSTKPPLENLPAQICSAHCHLSSQFFGLCGGLHIS
ncbi:hypothetical protein evm_004244 [Chilo suppressalis]|nr:hypothetical protein evm_004244 [Chilo suppressalis]